MSTTVAASVADLLKSATTKKARGRPASGYLWDQGTELPSRVLHLIRAARAAEEAQDLGKEELRSELEPWYAEQVRSQGYQASVRFCCGPRADGTMDELRVSLNHRYSKIPVSQAPLIEAIVGDKYHGYFAQQCSFKLRKEMSDDPEKVTAVVQAMISGEVAQHFGEWFEVEWFLTPTKIYTERRHIDLTKDQNAQLDRIVRQVVAFSDGNK